MAGNRSRHRGRSTAEANDRFAVVGLAVLLLASLLPRSAAAQDYPLRGRDIGCAELAAGRARQICNAIASSLTWQWTGHAIIAPAYKPSFAGIRDVYCRTGMGKGDLEVLKILKAPDAKRNWRPDWRLESAADLLLRIIQNRDATENESISSLLNPNSPDYLLKGGCS